MSAPSDSSLAAVLEQCRAHRAALARHVALPPDSLHRVLRCSRCKAWNLDTRVYQGFLQLGDGGARSCWSLDELRDVVATQHRGIHKVDRIDPCQCGAPAVSLALEGARFFHAMPGSGAELVVEVVYENEAVTQLRFGRGVLGGSVAFLEAESDETVHGVFGVPLSAWHGWRTVLAATEGALLPVEEGMALAAFPAGASAMRRDFDEALASDPDLRAYGLSPRVLADPSWQWLRADPTLAERPDTVMVMMLRHDVLAARIAELSAARGTGVRREGDTAWVEDGLARWPVELPTVAEEGLRRGYALSTMAAAAVTHALDRVETIQAFLAAIEKHRPGVTFAMDGMRVVPTHDGVGGRPIDLRVAPFGQVPDPGTLERDLRFYLAEAPSWSDPWRVCPCGAARTLSFHRALRAELGEVGVPAEQMLILDDAAVDEPTVRLLAASCERHVEFALRGILEGRPRSLESLVQQAELDIDRQRFTLRVARYHDADQRVAALVEGPNLLDATAHPRMVAGLAKFALDGARATRVHTLSRELAVVADADADRALVDKLGSVGAVLWTLRHGSPPTPVQVTLESPSQADAAGVFEQAADPSSDQG